MQLPQIAGGQDFEGEVLVLQNLAREQMVADEVGVPELGQQHLEKLDAVPSSFVVVLDFLVHEAAIRVGLFESDAEDVH